MKKFNLKNAFTAAGIAVFAGVLTIGVNAAIGVSSPTEVPNNSALVSPTFNGVDIQGGIKNSSGVDTPDGGGAVVINDDLGVQNNMVVGKQGLFAGNLQTTSNLIVGSGIGGGDLFVRGNISNDANDGVNDPVQIADDVKVSGVLDVAGAIKNTEGGILQIDALGGIDINSQIRNDTVAGTPVYFNDADGVAIKAGNLDIQAGGLKTTSDITINPPDGAKANLNLFEGADYGFNFEYDGAKDALNLWSRKFAGNEAIRTTWLKNGNVGIGTTTPAAKLSVNGKVTATEFGTHIDSYSGGFVTAPGKEVIASNACGGGWKVANCGVQTGGPFTLRTLYANYSTNTCYAIAKNDQAVNAYVYVQAQCFKASL